MKKQNQKKTICITGVVKVDLIRRFIKENKLTQKQFAKMCNINVWNLKSVLSDYQNYNILYLFKIAKAMNILPKDIFNNVA